MFRLLWKEWHEQSWKLGFGCVVLGALALIGLHARIVADEVMMQFVCFLGMSLLPVLAGTSLVPPERSEGTLESLLALPVSPRKILFAKTAMGAALCAGPLVVAGAVNVIVAGGRELTSSSTIEMYGLSILIALFMLVWTLALTIRLPSEARAGLLGIGLVICWGMATAGLAGERGSQGPSPLYALSPFSFVLYQSPPFLLILAVQVLMAGGLWLWASMRFPKGAEL